jgi:hypothetical protein
MQSDSLYGLWTWCGHDAISNVNNQQAWTKCCISSVGIFVKGWQIHWWTIIMTKQWRHDCNNMRLWLWWRDGLFSSVCLPGVNQLLQGSSWWLHYILVAININRHHSSSRTWHTSTVWGFMTPWGKSHQWDCGVDHSDLTFASNLTTCQWSTACSRGNSSLMEQTHTSNTHSVSLRHTQTLYHTIQTQKHKLGV